MAVFPACKILVWDVRGHSHAPPHRTQRLIHVASCCLIAVCMLFHHVHDSGEDVVSLRPMNAVALPKSTETLILVIAKPQMDTAMHKDITPMIRKVCTVLVGTTVNSVGDKEADWSRIKLLQFEPLGQ